jgi:hypothetical protein
MTRRLTLLLALALASLALLAGLVVQWPMAQAARWLPSASGGAVLPLAAQGRWHDGTLHLACVTPGGRRLDCGRYALRLEGAGLGLALMARQPGSGGLRLSVDAAGWRARATDWRLPAAALAAWLPVGEQLQMGGDMVITGEAQGAGKTALMVRWQGEIGEFSIGEQRLRIEGEGQHFNLRFGEPAAATTAEAATPPVRLEGAVSCQQAKPGSGGVRCSGEIIAVSAGADKRLEQLLTAAGRAMGPGRYSFRIDA